MNVLACAKQIPGPDAAATLDPTTFTLVRRGALILDDADAHGVEAAIRIAESSGGEVVLVSMAPDGETTGLLTALAMGAARAVIVSDPALSGSDALGTAKVLAAVARRLSSELVVAGTESSDGASGTVPVQVAELLGWPSLSFANHLEVREDGSVLGHRQTGEGYDKVLVHPPAVLTVTAGAFEPRYPTLRNVMGARGKPVEMLSLADLGIRPDEVGWTGARQRVVCATAAEHRGGGEIVIDDGSAHERIVDALERWKVI